MKEDDDAPPKRSREDLECCHGHAYCLDNSRTFAELRSSLVPLADVITDLRERSWNSRTPNELNRVVMDDFVFLPVLFGIKHQFTLKINYPRWNTKR